MADRDLAAILPKLEAKWLEPGTVLVEQRRPVEHLFFPTTAIIAILQVMEDGTSTEAATIGREGVLGVSSIIGSGESLARSTVQVGGEVLRLSVRAARQIFASDHPFYDLLRRFAAVFFLHVMQSLGCHQLHSARQRTCRWLLQTQDRAQADTFEMTQEFLAEILGLRRATVSEIAHDLQSRGIVEYRRGRLTILNRSVIEREACECYRVGRADFGRLLPPRAS